MLVTAGNEAGQKDTTVITNIPVKFTNSSLDIMNLLYNGPLSIMDFQVTTGNVLHATET